MLPMPLVMVLVIFGFRKKTEGARRLVYAATAKSPGASSRSSYTIYDCKYKWRLSLLSLNKRDRFVEIRRGRFAVCGFCDNICALLVVQGPTGKFYRFAKCIRFPTGICRYYR